MKKKLLILIFLCSSVSLFSADIFVDRSAPIGGDGSNWAMAFQDIQSAIDLAGSGDIIYIAEGIYRPQNQVNINVPLTIRGGYPAGGGPQDIAAYGTRIQGDFNPASPLFYILDISENSELNIQGLQFSNANTAIRCNSNLTADQIRIENLDTYGIFLRTNLDFCTITNSVFNGTNGAQLSGSLAAIETVTITNTVFEAGSDRAVIFSTGQPLNFTMSDCTVRDFNNSTQTISINSPNALITRLTAANNIQNSGPVVSYSNATGTLIVRDSEFSNNSGTNTVCMQINEGNVVVEDSDFTNNSVVGTFAYTVMNIVKSNATVRRCNFIGNSGDAFQNYLVNVRDFGVPVFAIFEDCVFRDNEAIGTPPNIFDISGDVETTVNNCVFDANSGQVFISTKVGAAITNSIFTNYVQSSRMLNISGDNVDQLFFENNRFFDNALADIRFSRFSTLASQNNSYLGEIDMEIDRIPDATFSKDYFRGNANGTPVISITESAITADNTVMLSTALNGTHTLISSFNSSLNFTNSLFSATNIDDTLIDIYFIGSGPLSMRNSIFWSGSDLNQQTFTGNTTGVTLEYSLARGESSTASGNLDGTQAANAPVFVNPAAFDFRMQDCSPTINVGENSFSTQPTDFNGNSRIFETTIDMGAYEAQTNQQAICTPPTAPSCTSLVAPGPVDGNTITVTNATIYWNADPDAISYNIRVGTSMGSADLVDETLFGGATSYPLANLPEASEIYVNIIPSNGVGSNTSCASEMFEVGTIAPAALDCAVITGISDGDTGVSSTLANIEWPAVSGATGYRVTVMADNSTDNDLSGAEVTDTFYNFNAAFDEGETVTVTVIPFNATDDATGCTSISFDIETTTPTALDCAVITGISDGDTDVSSTLANIEWPAVSGATGYRVTVMADNSTDNDVSGAEVTDTFYNFNAAFDEGETVTVTVIPFNATDDATGCTSISFDIETTTPTALDCAVITGISDGDTDVSSTLANIEWPAVSGATGYRVTVMADSSSDNDVSGAEVTDTFYNFNAAFDEGETVTVTVIPFNATDDATGCTSISFDIETATPTALDCAVITGISDGDTDVSSTLANIEWPAVSGATGYRVTVMADSSSDNDVSGAEVTDTFYNFNAAFDDGETVTVTVIPHNATDDAANCNSTTFTIENDVSNGTLSCGTLNSPMSGDRNVPATLERISWDAVEGATGYLVTVSGGSSTINNVDQEDVTGTEYQFLNDFDLGETVTVSIVAYNAEETATDCSEQSFIITTAEMETVESLYGFSPDGDGVNEYWEIIGIERYPQNTVFIYNRWGDMVFQMNGYDNNGNVFRGEANRMTKMGGGRLPEGTYFFDIQISGENDLAKQRGYLVLKR